MNKSTKIFLASLCTVAIAIGFGVVYLGGHILFGIAHRAKPQPIAKLKTCEAGRFVEIEKNVGACITAYSLGTVTVVTTMDQPQPVKAPNSKVVAYGSMDAAHTGFEIAQAPTPKRKIFRRASVDCSDIIDLCARQAIECVGTSCDCAAQYCACVGECQNCVTCGQELRSRKTLANRVQFNGAGSFSGSSNMVLDKVDGFGTLNDRLMYFDGDRWIDIHQSPNLPHWINATDISVMLRAGNNLFH